VSGRAFDRAFAWQMNASQAAAAAKLLADAAAHTGPVDEVIGIERGGIWAARAIAALLGVPIRTVCARHNATDGMYAEATGTVSCTAPGIEPGGLHGGVLLVDDIYGTGATLRTVDRELRARAQPGTNLRTATLCRNAGTASRPDLTVWDSLREWVIFPWEPVPEDISVPMRPLPDPVQVHAA
jgi:hypoxanthine phosphoribosyltransferase